MENNYQDALEEIESKIAQLLGRSDADMSHVVYQVDYQRALKKQIEGILLQLQNNEFQTVSAYLTRCYEEGFLGTMYSMQSQGVPLVFPINQEEIVQAIQHETNLSTNLYAAFDTKDLQKKIAGEISRGFSTGVTFGEIARNVASYTNIGLNNAKRITRTEGGRITETAAYNAQLRAKERGADVAKIWSAVFDARTRNSHIKIDGEIREVEEKYSNGLMFPCESGGAAAEVINCRCKSRTRAGWALDATQTKHLGEVSEMNDERKKEIAEKLHVPVEELDQYSDCVVPIKAKNYSDFKEQYKQGYWNYKGSDLQKEVEPRIAELEAKRTAKWASADASAKKYFNMDARDNLDDIIARGTKKIKQGISAFPDDDVLNDRIKLVKPDGNKFDVAMHGSAQAVAFGSRNANMSPRLLSSVIRHSEGYNGQDIRLLSCNTGSITNGDYCFAEELANALGVTVYAPNDLIFFQKDGTFKIGRNGQGSLIAYEPNERKRLK